MANVQERKKARVEKEFVGAYNDLVTILNYFSNKKTSLDTLSEITGLSLKAIITFLNHKAYIAKAGSNASTAHEELKLTYNYWAAMLILYTDR